MPANDPFRMFTFIDNEAINCRHFIHNLNRPISSATIRGNKGELDENGFVLVGVEDLDFFDNDFTYGKLAFGAGLELGAQISKVWKAIRYRRNRIEVGAWASSNNSGSGRPLRLLDAYDDVHATTNTFIMNGITGSPCKVDTDPSLVTFIRRGNSGDGTDAQPTVAVGVAAGSRATASMSADSNGEGGKITVNVGACPTTGTLATITFARLQPRAPRAVILYPANANANDNTWPSVVSLSATGFVLNMPYASGKPGAGHEYHFQVIY